MPRLPPTLLASLLLVPACRRDGAGDTAAPPPPDAGDPRVPADLDGDGYPEIVLAQTMDAEGNYRVDSTIWWGSAEGYSAGRTSSLPTLGAMGVEVADLDGDGWLDLVFADVSDGERRAVDSYVYWGGPEGYSEDRRTALPTVGCADVTVADVDQDGWLDLLFANRFDGTSYEVEAYVYWGGPEGYSVDRRLELPVVGASRIRVADLDGDGYRDIAIANGAYVAEASYVYWGSAGGWSADDRTELRTESPEGLEVADLDGDGWLDLVFAYWCDLGEGCATRSVVVWGSEEGLDVRPRTRLPTLGATDAAVADFDGDGDLDLLFVNSFDEDWDTAVDSTLYWADPGDPELYSEERSSSLPGVGSSEAAVLDFDGDGWLDLFLANFYSTDEDAEQVDSTLYWGGPEGYSPGRSQAFPGLGAAGVEAEAVVPR